jgi:hypothetical protein
VDILVRSTCLKLLSLITINLSGHVGVPRQLVITGDAASIPGSVAKAGLRLPLVAKPLVADGTAKSHAMSLAYDKYCLTELDPPLVLQEFVNHGTSYALSPFCLTAFHTFQVENYMASCTYMPLPLAPFSAHVFWLIRELCFLTMLEHRSHMQLSLVKLKI